MAYENLHLWVDELIGNKCLKWFRSEFSCKIVFTIFNVKFLCV